VQCPASSVSLVHSCLGFAVRHINSISGVRESPQRQRRYVSRKPTKRLLYSGQALLRSTKKNSIPRAEAADRSRARKKRAMTGVNGGGKELERLGAILWVDVDIEQKPAPQGALRKQSCLAATDDPAV
jgi:hypothetical protein